MTTPTGTLFYDPRPKPLSTTGAIQPGCYYQFYLTGTTTLTNVYADAALTTPLSQTPGTGQTTAASDGRLVPLYLNPTTIYRVQLYSQTNVLLEDTDPYVPPASTQSFTQTTLGQILYPQSTAELAVSVTPTNYVYPPGHLLRYGAVMDGVTDDAGAWAKLALVMGQGVSGYCPTGTTMIKSQITIVAPAFQSIALNGYGCTIKTTGAIYGLTITGGFMGGLDINGILFDITTDTLCLGSINFLGCQNCRAIDCWNLISNSQGNSANYALVVMQPTDPTNDNTGPFWNKVVRCGTRQSSGNVSFYANNGVLMLGASNAAEISNCNFVSCISAITIRNQITGGGTGTLANACNIHDNSFESLGTAVTVNGQNFAGSHIEGLRISANRFEAITAQAFLFENLTNDSSVATQISRNYYISNTVNYIIYSSANITVNVQDPAITPSFPYAVVFTAPPSGTSGTLTANWPFATGQWQIIFSDAEVFQATFTNGNTTVTWPSAIVGAPTVNASVTLGQTLDETNQGPHNRTSIAGDAEIFTAPTEYGTVVGTSAVHQVRIRNRSGGGGYIQFPSNNGDFRGVDGLSANSARRSRRLRGAATFAASTTVTVTLSPAEPDTNYLILIEGNATAGAMTPGSKATGSFVITAANSNSQTVNWMLVGF